MPEVHLGLAEHEVRPDDARVAGHRELGAAAQHRAVERGDDRLLCTPRSARGPRGRRRQIASHSAGVGERGELADVGAGERAVVAREDDALHATSSAASSAIAALDLAERLRD